MIRRIVHWLIHEGGEPTEPKPNPEEDGLILVAVGAVVRHEREVWPEQMMAPPVGEWCRPEWPA